LSSHKSLVDIITMYFREAKRN